MNSDNIQYGFQLENKGDTPLLIKQIHGNKIVPYSNKLEEADGLCTFEKEKAIHIYTADCIAFLFYSKKREDPILAIHAGWKGVVSGILDEALRHFKASAQFIHLIVGPSILSCCFEVKEDFIQTLKLKELNYLPFLISKNGKMYFDLLGYSLKQLNLPKSNINLEYSRCTFCSSPKLPSFRREKNTDWRIRSWIIKNSS